MQRSNLIFLVVPLAAVIAVAALGQEDPTPKPTLDTDMQKYSYAIGQNIGNSIKQDAIELDMDAFTAGMTDAMAGKNAMTPEDVQTALQKLQEDMQAKAQAKAANEGQANLEAGQAYLAENAKREGVTVTASGLQYEVLKAGDGASPKATDRVSVHYRGTLLDETEFDSSYSRGQPAAFPVNGVISGWTEALQLMKVGAKWKLHIPADLAYGANPRPGGPIGPNAVLIFEVELLAIE